MLEDLAYRYSQLPQEDLKGLSYGLVILGGIVGGLTNRSVAEIRRAPYFALSGLIFLGTAVVSFTAMRFLVPSLAGGYFWSVVATELLASVVGGYFLARIACARSRDAYGHARWAALAFIPLANLWLLFTPSKNAISANRAPTIPLLTGGLGVLTGFVLLGLGVGLSTYSQVEATRRVEAAASAGIFAKAMLGRTLEAIAAEVQTPLTVDETTTLVRMETDGPIMRYVYEVELPMDLIPPDMRLGLTRQNCTHEGLAGVIDTGAIIQHAYYRSDGTEIGMVEVTKQACGR